MKYTTEIPTAKFDENGLSTIAGWVEVYICDPLTREYIKASLDNVPLGGSIVAGAYLDKPELPTQTNVAVIRSADEKNWLHVNDYRGEVAYNIETQQPTYIDFIGDLPNSLTLLEPKTEFDKWNGKKWITDTDAQKVALISEAENKKAILLQEATMQITYLQDSVDVGFATEDEKISLNEWKKYRVQVNRVDTSLAPNINWPEKL